MGKGNENLDQDVILKFIQVNCRLYFHRKLLIMQYLSINCHLDKGIDEKKKKNKHAADDPQLSMSLVPLNTI